MAPFVAGAWDVESVGVIGSRVLRMAWIRRPGAQATGRCSRCAPAQPQYARRRMAHIYVFLDTDQAKEAARATA